MEVIMKSMYLAGGCFWGIQKYLDQFPGIISTTVGYANGNTENPTYEEVKSQKSGHSETVKVVYDESIITLAEILTSFYRVIDPIAINKQGVDEGISYRTGIYYIDTADLKTIQQVTSQVQQQYDIPLTVEIKKLINFYSAEEYHQKYLEKNPQGYCHIDGCFLPIGGEHNDSST